MKLPDIRFFDRFRLHIILQNKSSYITLFVGIVFANILLLFGMMMAPLLDHYQEQTVDNMIADYQYILNVPDEIDEDDTYTLYGALSRFLTPSLETENKRQKNSAWNHWKPFRANGTVRASPSTEHSREVIT